MQRAASSLSEGNPAGSGGAPEDTGAPKTYPPAKATNEAVLAERELFNSCLTDVHEALGTRMRIPVVGGKDLDMWLLYKQVRFARATQIHHSHPNLARHGCAGMVQPRSRCPCSRLIA